MLFFSEPLEYPGHIIYYNKFCAVIELRRPRNVDEVCTFLVMVTYNPGFIPDLCTNLQPFENFHKIITSLIGQ